VTESPAQTDARGFAEALAARGYPCVVEARERLALLAPSGAWPAMDDATARRAVHGLATQFGFTHVALEVSDEREPGASGAPRAARD
jgi:hypothetical protein